MTQLLASAAIVIRMASSLSLQAFVNKQVVDYWMHGAATLARHAHYCECNGDTQKNAVPPPLLPKTQTGDSMNAAFKSLMFGSLFAGLVSLAALASAAPPYVQIRLSPGSGTRIMPLVPATPSIPATPQLGFYGHFEWGYGMVVDSVVWGTPARQMGLENGDVIVAVNGLWLRSQSDYYRALGYSGDHAQVTVQDVRSSRLITRTAHLHGDIGYRSAGPGVSLELR